MLVEIICCAFALGFKEPKKFIYSWVPLMVIQKSFVWERYVPCACLAISEQAIAGLYWLNKNYYEISTFPGTHFFWHSTTIISPFSIFCAALWQYCRLAEHHGVIRYKLPARTIISKIRDPTTAFCHFSNRGRVHALWERLTVLLEVKHSNTEWLKISISSEKKRRMGERVLKSSCQSLYSTCGTIALECKGKS